MRNLIFVLAVTTLAFPAFAQKETGALEGTVVDLDGRPLRSCGCLIIKRVDNAVPSSKTVTEWDLRTDKMGHFLFKRFPAGTYSITVIGRDGRILKEIPDVRVEAGIVRSLDSVLGAVTPPISPPGTLPPPGKKVKPTTPPTQPDIVRGCITLRNITFQRARLMLLNSNVGISGSITNDCGRDAYVSIDAAFFGANGDRVGNPQIVQKLVPAGGADFRVLPDLANATAVQYQDGRITGVSVEFQP